MATEADDTSLPTVEESPTVTAERAFSILGIGRTAGYEAVKRGDIPSIRLNGRILIPTAPLRRMLGIETVS